MVTDSADGESVRRRPRLPISRVAGDAGFTYLLKGRRIARKSELARIEALAIPPAWIDVEIAKSPRNKVLARGVDAAGRVQAIYNPSFRKRQDRRKFERVEHFGRALPALREQIDRDLSRRTLCQERVVASVVHLIDTQLFRVGSSRYAKQNHSYGITTLRRRHVSITGDNINFSFVAKSGKRTRKTLRDARVARLLRRLSDELPGAEIFRFVDGSGEAHVVRRRHINGYVKQHAGESFTAKDFRTWGATVVVATALLDLNPEVVSSPAAREAALRDAVRDAAERLGNTPAVAKSSYVDPRLFSAVQHPRILREAQARRRRMRGGSHHSADERGTLALLQLLSGA